jgi:hypothetical protein
MPSARAVVLRIEPFGLARCRGFHRYRGSASVNSAANPRRNFYAQGRLKTGAMNKTEAAYEVDLRDAQALGDILWYKFEGVKLRLADNTFYTPDFVVLGNDKIMECHEVKGFWTDDARVKIKVAAELYPFRFKAIKARAKRDGGGWSEEAF